MNAGEIYRHEGSKQMVVIDPNQGPVAGLEWIHEPGETVYVRNTSGQRIPMCAATLQEVLTPTCRGNDELTDCREKTSR